jgi:serine/threonine protein kinase
MHSRRTAHRDIKPHNILVVRPENNVLRSTTSVFDEEDHAGASEDDDDGMVRSRVD